MGGVEISRLPTPEPTMIRNSAGWLSSRILPPSTRYPPATDPITTNAPTISSISSHPPLVRGQPGNQAERGVVRATQPGGNNGRVEARSGTANQLTVDRLGRT